ncbi:MAG: hypothetical protein H6959_06955 [Chromatiaceae bacterium]|nr:hypothetical protein [Gammaproteobacteria bacterium]MCP5300569.1 hypothetical protein [Chromatiaceae bacterium]MCP5422641.1 hypothetical protein [Chromatiaceae bacterium]
MFRQKIAFLIVVGLLVPAIASAADAAKGASMSVAEQAVGVAPERYVEQQLDWRSYYLNRIDNRRNEVPFGRMPWFRPDA